MSGWALTISCWSMALTSRPCFSYSEKIARLPSRPPSSAEYQWNSTVFCKVPFWTASSLRRARNASRIVTVPLPSSSAPGAGRIEGSQRLIESWCAAITIVEFVWPGIVAMMELCCHGCGKASAWTPSAPDLSMMA